MLARSEAFKRNATITLCASLNGSSCSGGTDWASGWVVLSGSTVLQAQEATASGFRMTGTQSSLTFQPVGLGTTTATFTACRNSPLGNQERVITVGTTVRNSLARTTTGTCP